VTPANMADYLANPNVGCVGGTWLTPADAVKRRDWAKVATLTSAARELADTGKSESL
jgi:2-dehydro-3-deoxyphosphogluconate aldolase / (4S)-4-hydroxy-2-oxoglutarate aldolase